MQNKTFRLFISSPFSDFEKEREVLHKRVFPKIEKYCSKHHLSFQPVDLRWGVNEEAQLDQKTLEVCLEEVRACKHFPHPNFLIMAGDRYGYVPCPYMIEKSEFEKIKDCIDNTDEVNALETWYKLDENQIYICPDDTESTAYILQPRTDKYADYPNWEKQENFLRDILQAAANKIFIDKENKAYQKYFLSATEQEVIEGICQFKNKTNAQKDCDEAIDKKYVFGYLRDINNASGKYLDTDKNLQLMADTFKDNVEKVLDKDNNIIRSGFNSIEDYEESKLKEFEEYITKKLINAIDEQVKDSKEISELEQEISEQTKFLKDKIKGFQGRETTLAAIKNYLVTDTIEPLIIHGSSGIGKSSLMAKAIESTKTDSTIFRFVGATANSTTIKNILISIVDEFQEKNIIEKLDEYEKDENKFETQIKDILLSIEEKTTIFIDALDQLQQINYLNWLPSKLPSNLKIILTVLNDKNYKKDTHYYNLLNERYDKTNFIDITKDSLEKNKEDLIIELLKIENRQLDEYQTKYLLRKWEKTNYSPLYLKIAIEEVKHWRSEDTTQKLESGVQAIILEYIKNLTSLYHHEELLVQKVFGYIHVSKDGLSEKELLEILSEDLEDDNGFNKAIINKWHKSIQVKNPRRDSKEEHILPISVWSRLHTLIKPFLIERNINNQPLIKFFHRQFLFAINSILDDKEKLHNKLSQYFLTLQDHSKTWDERYHNLHMLDETPYNLFYANNFKILKDLVTNIEFVGAIYNNNKEDFFNSIVEKFKTLDKSIHPWYTFYRENNHLISNFDVAGWKPSQSLLQLSYEHGDNSPISLVCDKNYERLNSIKWLKNNYRPKHYVKSGLIKVLRGHIKPIIGVSVLQNKDILSYSNDCTLRLWGNNGIEKKILIGHTDYILGAIELKNNEILSFSADCNLIIWSLAGPDRLVKPKFTLKAHSKSVNGAIEIDKNIISYSDDGKIIIWSIDGEKIQEIDAHDKKIKGMLKLNNENILTYSDDLTLKYWNIIRIKENILLEKDPIIFLGHKRRIRNVKELKNGNILSYGYDRKILVWNTKGELLKSLIGHEDMIWGALELNNNKIYSFADDMKTCIWDLNTDCFEIEPDVKNIHNRYIWGAIQLKNDPNKVLSFSDDNTLKLFDESNDAVIEFKGHARTVKGVIELDNYFVSFSDDNSIRLWDKNGKELRYYQGHSAGITGLKKLSQNMFLSYSVDNTLRIWKIDEDDLIFNKEGHRHKINGILKYNQNKLITFSDDSTMRLWGENGKEEVIFKGHTGRIFNAIILKNEQILSYSADNTIKFWDITGKEENNINIIDKHLNVIEKNIDGVKIYNFGRDKYILNIIESVSSSKVYGVTYDDTFFIYDYATNKNTKYDIEVTSTNNKFKSINGNQLLYNNKIIGEITDTIFGIKELRNNKVLAFSKTGRRKIFDLNDPNNEREFKAGDRETLRGTIELNNGNLLTYSSSSGMEIRDQESLNVIAGMEKHTDSIWGVKLKKINNTEKIISYSFDNTKRIWSTSGTEEQVLSIDREPASGILELSNGDVVFYLLNNTVHIYNNKINKTKYIGGHTDFINGIEELDSNTIVSYSDDGQIILWDILNNKRLKSWNLDSEVIGSRKIEGNKIIFYSNLGDLAILSNSELVLHNNAHNNSILGVELLNDKTMLSYSNDGSVKIWDIHNSIVHKFDLCTHKNNTVKKVLFLNNKLYALFEDNTLIIWLFDNNENFQHLNKVCFARNQINFYEQINDNYIVIDNNELFSYELQD